jgi:lipopolysaccharide exporter
MSAVETTVSVGRISRGFGWSTASNFVLRLGSFAISIVMARLIAPDQFGVFAVALTILTICGTMAEFGLGTDLVRARDLEHRIPTVATLGLVTSATLALGMFVGSGALAQAFESPSSASVIQVMSIAILGFGFSIVPAAILQREFKQGTLFAINSLGLLTSASTMIALALHGLGPMALAIGQVASQAVTVITLYVATRRRLRFGFDRRIARESVRFGLPLALANMVSWALLSVDNLIVSRALGPTLLGLYVLAFNVSSWPMSAIGQSIRAVALPAFAHLATAESRNRALKRLSGPLWGVSILAGLGLATLATPVIQLIYGQRWSGAAEPLVGLALFGGLRVVFDLLATFLIAVGETRPVLIVQLLWLTAMVPTMWLGVTWFGLAGASWAHVVVAVIVVLPAYLYCLRRVGVAAAKFMAGAIVPLLVAVPTAAVSMLVVPKMPTPLTAILAGGSTALVLYAAPLAPWFARRLKALRVTSVPIEIEG